MEDDILLEPLKAYDQLKERHRQNAENCFDALVAEAGVSPEENAEITKERSKILDDKGSVDKKTRRVKLLRTLLIAAVILLALTALFFAFRLTDEAGALIPLSLVVLVLSVVAAIGALVLIFKTCNPRIKEGKAESTRLNQNAQALEQKAWAQMAALNAKYDWNLPDRLVFETLPQIQIDKYFDEKKYDYFNTYCDFQSERNANLSLFRARSGNSDGLPFLLTRNLFLTMRNHLYTGSRIVSWTETEYDSQGRLRTVTRSQTLTATVTKPAPEYFFKTCLMYGSNAAPDLHFSRSPIVPHDADDKKIDAMVRNGEKELEKKAREAVEQGGSYNKLANSEFEVLFGAENRDNETQFRLLFTPLAQRNMVALLRSKEPYGDDFSFEKNGRVNVISSQHGTAFDFDANPARFSDFDLAHAKEAFIRYNEQYFQSLFFDFAPLFSLPLYRQEKADMTFGLCEEKGQIGLWEAESAANTIPPALLSPPEAVTRPICKITGLYAGEEVTRADVTAHCYSATPRIDIIPVMARNGQVYPVSVPWTEYLPVEKTTQIELRAVTMTREEFLKSNLSSDPDLIFTGGLILRVLSS